MGLIVACVEVGNYLGRGEEYVKKLYRCARQHLRREFDFYVYRGGENLCGWWNKLALFKPGVFAEGSRIAYFDLDTIIRSDISALADYNGNFAILRDFYRPEGYGSGVMLWRAGWGSHIWQAYQAAGFPQKDSGGDQAWIEKQVHDADRLQDLFPGMFASFKATKNPESAAVLCFHGKPKPHECKEYWQ